MRWFAVHPTLLRAIGLWPSLLQHTWGFWVSKGISVVRAGRITTLPQMELWHRLEMMADTVGDNWANYQANTLGSMC